MNQADFKIIIDYGFDFMAFYLQRIGFVFWAVIQDSSNIRMFALYRVD